VTFHTPSSPFVATHTLPPVDRARQPVTAFARRLAICAALYMANPAQAATTTVSTCDEAALRAAVTNAAPGDTLTFTCSGTITLTAAGGGQISIGKNLTIDGSGQSVTISGGGSVGVIEIGTGVTVTLSQLTIADGADGDAGAYGVYGGILNLGTLTLDHSTVSGNTAQCRDRRVSGTGARSTSPPSTITGNTGLSPAIHHVAGTLNNHGQAPISANIGARPTSTRPPARLTQQRDQRR